MKTIYIFFILLTAALALPKQVYAQNNTIQGKVVEVINGENSQQDIFKVYLSEQNQNILAQGDSKNTKYIPGDKVLVLEVENATGESTYYLADHLRTDGIFVLFLIFVGVVLLVSKKSGAFSILGMIYSFFIIFKVLLPQIYAGNNPFFTTFLSMILISPVSFVLSHGFNQKTFTALFATIFSLTITSVLAYVFINVTHLSGFGSEEAYFLQVSKETLDIKGVLLAGIIIGTLGILDDATVTQTSIVAQLRASNKNLSKKQLFSKAMAVGHDHIASTVNTLILVYTGAALPLFLIFLNSGKGFLEVLNTQMIAEEVVTMLVSSIGLILAIPISTIMTTQLNIESQGHSHHHH